MGYVMFGVYIKIEHVKVKNSYIKFLVKRRYSKLLFIILFITSLYFFNEILYDKVLLGVFLVFETV